MYTALASGVPVIFIEMCVNGWPHMYIAYTHYINSFLTFHCIVSCTCVVCLHGCPSTPQPLPGQASPLVLQHMYVIHTPDYVGSRSSPHRATLCMSIQRIS